MKKFVYLDFEFNRTSEAQLRLVCCSVLVDGVTTEYWLLAKPKRRLQLASDLLKYQDRVFVAYGVTAEARSMLSLDISLVGFKFIDLFVEWRCLTNHNHALAYGKQLVKGKVKMTFPPKPKWEQHEGENQEGFVATHSLAEASYKLLGIQIDTKEKDRIRNLIIENSPTLFEHKDEVIAYCTSDVTNLPALLKSMISEYSKLLGPNHFSSLLEDMMLRGNFAMLTAYMESWGYPVDVKNMRSFSDSVPVILYQTQKEINSLFPEIAPFRFDKKRSLFTLNTKAIRKWIESTPHVDRWMRTETGLLGLSLDAFKQFFDFRHDYPKDNFGAQIVRYLTLKQNINGFSPTAPTSIWDSLGEDGRVRPYFNIYRAQSSRSQPKATGFLFLKSAWMRCLCVPPKGKAITAIDYGSQEFLLSALISGDNAMWQAYKSGDVYLAYAKECGLVPQDGTREKYEKERNECKPLILGMSYIMSKYGLSAQLSQDLKRDVPIEEAQEHIDTFYNIYRDLKLFQEDIQVQYREDGYLRLPCGWVMFGDNQNFRSVANYPIQGTAASIMRKAVELAMHAGLKTIKTLHDAIYIEHDHTDLVSIDILYDCMHEAFIYYFGDKEKAGIIRMDATSWSPEYPTCVLPDGKLKYHKAFTPKGREVVQMKEYIDKRGYNEYKNFKRYFTDRDEDLV